LLFKSASVTGLCVLEPKECNINYFKFMSYKLQEGKLRIINDDGQESTGSEFFGMDGIIRAVEHLDSGNSIGKVIARLIRPTIDMMLKFPSSPQMAARHHSIHGPGVAEHCFTPLPEGDIKSICYPNLVCELYNSSFVSFSWKLIRRNLPEWLQNQKPLRS
ncbi:prostaglandin reductase 3, partial [Trichonephila clavipes]